MKLIILGILGVLIFLAPLKFGMPIGSDFFYCPDGSREDNSLIFSPWPADFLCLGAVILFALWILGMQSAGRIRVRYSSLDFAVFLFLLTAVISAAAAPEQYQAYLCLTQYFCYVLVYFMVLNLMDSAEDNGYILNMVFMAAVLISLYAIYQYFIGLPETRLFAKEYVSQPAISLINQRLLSDRVFATFIYPNTLAGYLLLCLPAAVVCPKSRVLRVIVLALMLYTLFLTFYELPGLTGELTKTMSFRFENWAAGVKMIKARPLLGNGLYNFSVWYPQYKTAAAEEIRNAHNNFLQVWAEQGLFGFASFCLIWIIVIIKGLRAGRYKWLTAGILLFMIHNFLDFDWYVPGLTVVFWALAGFLVNTSGGYRERVICITSAKARIIVLAAVILLTLAALYVLAGNLTARYYLQKATECFHNQESAAAVEYCRKSSGAEKLAPNPDTYLMMGRLAAIAKKYPESIAYYKKAVAANRYEAAAYYNLALSYLSSLSGAVPAEKMPLINQAGGTLAAAVKCYPVNPYYRLQLARFYESTGQTARALAEYQEALVLSATIADECRKTRKTLGHLVFNTETTEDIRKRIGILQN